MVVYHRVFEMMSSKPNHALAAVISATECESPSASRGSARPAASRSAVTSGRRGLYRSTTMPATIAPTPHDPEMAPQAEAPPSERTAMTGPSTKKAGSAKLPQACASRLIQYQGRIASSCQPSARSAMNDPGAGSVRGGTRRTARQARLTKKEAASAAKSQPVPKTAMSTPPAAGPATLKKLCGSPSRLLACCSWSFGTVSGTSAVEAGPKNDDAAPYSAAPAPSSQTCACPLSSRAANVAW